MIAQTRITSVCKRCEFFKLSFNAKQLHKSSFFAILQFPVKLWADISVPQYENGPDLAFA